MNSHIYVCISRLGIFMEMRLIVEIIKRDWKLRRDFCHVLYVITSTPYFRYFIHTLRAFYALI